MASPNNPIILSPNQGIDFTTSEKNIIISGVVNQIDPTQQKITQNYIVNQVLVNGTASGVNFTPNASAAQLGWTLPVTLQSGQNTFFVKAVNNRGDQSQEVIFQIDLVAITAPVINFPNNGKDFETDIGTFSLIGSLDPVSSKVVLLHNGVANPNIVVIEQVTWTVTNIPLVAGNNVFEVYSETIIGEKSESDFLIITYVPGGLALPAPSVTFPTSLGNFQVRESNVTLGGETDPSTETITYSVNGAPFIDFKTEYQPRDRDWTIADIVLSEGINNITIKATSVDAEEAITTISVNFVPPVDLFITIDYPQDGTDFATNVELHNLAGTVSPNATKVEISIRGMAFTEEDVIHTPGDTIWSYEGLQLRTQPDAPGDINTIVVRATDKFGNVSDVAQINIRLIVDSDVDLIVSPPTGLTTKSFKNGVEVIWAENPEPEVVGYNVYYSLDPAGGTSGFVRANVDRVTESSFEEDVEFPVSSTTITTGNVKTTTDQAIVQSTQFFTFAPSIDPEGNPFEQGIPIYFVVTAISFDSTTRTETESLFSAEVSAEPIIIDQTTRDIVPRTFGDVQGDIIESIVENNEVIDIFPGSVLRDIFVDPGSQEFRKLYVVLEFISKSQSFLTLRLFDDANNDGESDPVSESAAKQELAFSLNISNDEVQQLIDEQFDKLAENFNVQRLDATSSQVELIAFTTSEPTEDIIIQRGATFGVGETDQSVAPIVFEALTQAEIRAADALSFYNRELQRYEIRFPAQSTTTGSDTNVPSGVITTVLSGVNDPTVRVTNEQASVFGSDQESNSSLADRASLALVSIDTGTRGGYEKTVLAIPGIQLAKVVSAGNNLMERDYDDLRQKHIGGKVDIYIQGDTLFSFEEKFSFSFPQRENELADIVSIDLFQISPRNSELSTQRPIFEVTKITNVTKKLDYDLTGFSIIGGAVIDLDETIELNQLIGLDRFDIIEVTYRFRDSLEFTPANQPVNEVISVVGDLSGDLSRNYNFLKEDDPLFFGNSILAKDSIEIFFDNALPLTEFEETLGLTGTAPIQLAELNILDGSTVPGNPTYSIDTVTVQSLDELTLYEKDVDYQLIEGNFVSQTTIVRLEGGSIEDLDGADNVVVKYFTKGDGLPVEQVQQITDEEITLVAENTVDTMKVGVFPETIEILNFDKTSRFVENFDYQIIAGDNTTPTKIKRLTNGNIPDGSTVKVSYRSGENITVRYSTNLLVDKAQDEVNEIRHVTADVVVKEAIEVPIDISVTVVVKTGFDQTIVENAIRTAITQNINQLSIGDQVYQSNVIELIEIQEGVSHIQWSSVTNRLDKMVRADNVFINRELIDISEFDSFEEEITLISTYPIQLSTGNVSVNTIQVTSLNETITYVQGEDYNILFGSALLPPKIVRVSTGSISDGATVKVFYDAATFGVFSPPVIIISDEPHQLVGNTLVELNNNNVDESSIVIRSSDRTRVYVLDVDYGIVPGTDSVPPRIFRIEAGSIADGATVLVSYSASSISTSEIQITDEPHQLIASNPESLNNSNVNESSITARTNSQILIKGTDFDIISGTATIPPQILALPGGSIQSGEVVFVSYVTSPFGINEQDKVTSYITRDPVLEFSTQDNGGHKIQVIEESLTSTPRMPGGNNIMVNPVAILEDDTKLTLVDSDDDVSSAAGQGYIRGDGRVVVSLTSGSLDDRPEDHAYRVSYVVLDETGSKDIITTDLEFPKVGRLSLTFIQSTVGTATNTGIVG